MDDISKEDSSKPVPILPPPAIPQEILDELSLEENSEIRAQLEQIQELEHPLPENNFNEEIQDLNLI